MSSDLENIHNYPWGSSVPGSWECEGRVVSPHSPPAPTNTMGSIAVAQGYLDIFTLTLMISIIKDITELIIIIIFLSEREGFV